ncbi:MAG: acriflavin resistance protein [Ruminococcaceae bacterium]|nr:acriflavin resistance protein [Oscillospiraceae bacterium]
MTKISVKKPFTVLVAVVLVFVLGIVSFTRLKTDLLPKMDLPYVIVMTTAPGASPERVETTVTQPLESVLATTSGLENMQSISMENASIIIMEFNQKVNMDSAMIEMSSSIDMVEGYFEDTVSAPMLMKLNPDMLPVQVLSVDMDGMDIKELSSYIENDFTPYLERIDGVATVDVTGLVEDYISIQLNQEKIDAINDDILKAVDGELYKTKKDLDKAKQELADGKQELADGKKELEDGKKELEDGKEKGFEELAKYSVQMDEGMAQISVITGEVGKLQADIGLYEGQEKAMQGYMAMTMMPEYQQLINGIADAKQGINELETRIADAKTAIGQLAASLEGAQTIKAQLAGTPLENASVAVIKAADSTLADVFDGFKAANFVTDENTDTIDTVIANIEAAKAAAEAGLVQMEELLAQTKATLAGLEKTKAEMLAPIVAAGLTEDRLADPSATLAQIAQNKAEAQADLIDANALKESLTKEVNKIKKLAEELEKGQMEAVSGIAVGEAQIASAEIELEKIEAELENAEKQLEDGIEQFEKAKKDALRQANIDSLVTQAMISNILTAQNFSMPAGYIMLGDERVTVKVGEKFSDLESLKNLLLVDMDMDGVDPIYLKDVATVEIKDNSGDSFVKINGNDGIVLSLNKSSVASTSEVSESVTKAIKELEEKTPGLHVTTLMDQGDYIGMIVDSVLSNLIYGGIIALLVLIIFLKSARPTMIIGMSIPLSVLVAIVAMYFTDVTLNIISLSGLALAVGMLVDNSIVVIENIFRLRSMGYSAVKAAVVGTKQVGGAIAASTLTTICVFLPIVFTEGLTRQIFTDMGLTIGYVLVASLVVALTFVPCLASKVLGEKNDVTPKFMIKITNLYEKALRLNLKHKWFVIVLSVGLLALSVFNALSMPMAFIPAMDGPQMTMTLSVPGTTSDEDLYEQGWDIAQKVQNVQDVDTVAVMSEGTSVASMTSSAENNKTLSFYVVMTEKRTLSNVEVGTLIEEALPEYKDSLSVTTESIDMSALGGSGFSVAVKGNDFDKLGEISADIAAELEKIDGIAKADDGSGERSNELRIEINKEAAMKKGLTTAQVYQKVAEALTEETTTTTFTFNNKDLDGYITSDTAYSRDTIENLKIASVVDEDGDEEITTLGQVATITTAQSPQSINRDNQSRTYTVTATFENGVNTTLVSRQAEAAMENFELPDGYQIDVGGENQMVMEMMGDMALMILLAIVFIYLIMVAQFQSLRSPFIVLFTIPLAFTGGLLALQLTNTVLSIVSMIGFLVLTGVVVNNGIVFIDYVNQLRAEGMELYDALVQTGKDRIRPILMTALTTILAMSTMAIGVGMGAEMSQGMAIVSIGGLAYATLLTLFLVPSLYAIMHKKPLKVIDVDFEDEE